MTANCYRSNTTDTDDEDKILGLISRIAPDEDSTKERVVSQKTKKVIFLFCCSLDLSLGYLFCNPGFNSGKSHFLIELTPMNGYLVSSSVI